MKRSNQNYLQKKPLLSRLPSLVLYLVAGFVFAILVLPILIVIPISFSSAEFLRFPPPGFSLQWYERYFTNVSWIEPTIRSFQIASITCITATILGTILAFVLVKGKFPGKNIIYSFALSPMVIPPIITAIAIYFFYSKLRLVGTITGLVIAHTVLALPFVLVLVSTTLKGFDVTLERASLSLGANPLKTFLFVTLPIIRPGVLSGALFAFITSFDELICAIFIAGVKATTLPKKMWDGLLMEINPTIAAVSSLLIGISIFLMVMVAILERRAEANR